MSNLKIYYPLIIEMGVPIKICCPYCKRVINQTYICGHLLSKCREPFLRENKKSILVNKGECYKFDIDKKKSIWVYLNFGTKSCYRIKDKMDEHCEKQTNNKKNGSLHQEVIKKIVEQLTKEEDNKEETDPQPLISNTDEKGWTPREQALLHLLYRAKVRELKITNQIKTVRKELEAEKRKNDLEDDYTDTEEEQEQELTEEELYEINCDSAITNRFPELLEDGLLLAYKKFKC